MCGIQCLVQRRRRRCDVVDVDDVSSKPIVVDNKQEETWLTRRGPDEQHCCSLELNDDYSCKLRASVLRLRRTHTSQPVEITLPLQTKQQQQPQSAEVQSAGAAYLCWNGEIYQVLETDEKDDDNCDKKYVSWQESDTAWMAQQIQQLLVQHWPHVSNDNRELFEQQLGHLWYRRLVNAEFAVCLVISGLGVYYGRDVWGRRSLVVQPQSTNANDKDKNDSWQLASVANDSVHDTNWQEVPPGTVWCWRVATQETTSTSWIPTVAPPKLPPTPPQLPVEHYVQRLQTLLYEAVERRIKIPTSPPTWPPQVTVLFSGGLDSVVLAHLALKVCIPETGCRVHLVNVSFVADNSDNTTTTPVAADTQAAYASFQDLQRLFPDHPHLNLKHRRVSWSELVPMQPRLAHLLQPLEATVMNVNIATALWFAADTARASNNDNDTTKAKNRILFSGLGADELLGGYGRHRKAWEQGRLREELTLDQDRLWHRNGGRDDRVLSDTSQEVRYPFLDAHVTHFLTCECPLDYLCDFSLPSLGDKRLLRRAAEDWGLHSASVATKRAIQFGSRISHVVDKQRFGSRRKANRQSGQQQQQTVSTTTAS